MPKAPGVFSFREGAARGFVRCPARRAGAAARNRWRIREAVGYRCLARIVHEIAQNAKKPKKTVD
jgi:hypothetical protein